MSNEYKVGDEAELGPVRMNKFLGEVAAQGGRVEVKGNVAKVVYMPEAHEIEDPTIYSGQEPKETKTVKAAVRKKAAPKTGDA